MKKALKITGIVLLSLLVLLAVVPFAFKGKIKKYAVEKGNEMIVGSFDFGSLGVSLLRDFPQVSVSLHDFYLVGAERFEGDTLARVGRVGVSFNLASLFSDKGYEVTRVVLDNAVVNAIVLEDGTPNWDILKDTGEEEQTETESSSDFNIMLKALSVNNLALTYDDREGKYYASAENLSATMSGDLSASRSTLKVIASAENAAFRNGGIPLLSGAKLYIKADVDADLDNSVYTLKDNILRLNAIEAALEGWVALKDDDAIDMDLKFSTPDIDFKQILSMVPAIYAKDFESVKATGEVSLDGWVKGTYKGDDLPAFDLRINVADGTFRYPDLPKGLDKINIAAAITNPGGNADLTRVDVNPFSFSMAGNPFSVKAVVTTPVSDMAFDMKAVGTLDLGMVKEVYPLDSMQLNGVVKADVAVAGRMSAVEAEQYDRISAQGSVVLSNMLLSSPGMDDVNIKRSSLAFSPRYMELSQTEVTIGRNDLSVEGRVENYMAYALKDATLKGTAKLASKYFNANDFLQADDAAAEGEEASLTAIEVPRNLDLALTASFTELLYDNISLKNVTGQVAVKDGRAELRGLDMATLGGKVKMDGSYSTAAGVDKPEFKAALSLDAISFADLFSSFVTIQKIVPIFENLSGNLSGKLNLSSTLDEHMSPVLSTLNGQGSLSTKDISLSKVGVISTIAELAKVGGITDSKVKDLKVDFAIADGKIATKPFDVKLGEVAINLSGTSSLDQSLDYTGDVKLPASMAATTRISNIPLKIGGTFTSPKVSLDMKQAASQVVKSLTGEGLAEAGKKLGVDLADAQAQKKALVDAATNAGETIMEQAKKQADALVDKAGSNALAKLAAEKASAKVLSDAQKKVDAMVAKATAQGDSIVSKANR